MTSKKIDLQVHKEVEEYCIVPYWDIPVHESAPVARKRVSNSSRLTAMILRARDGGPTLDTRVAGQRVTRSSTHSTSDCSTIAEWVDMADTKKYKARHICKFCDEECSGSSALARHTKFNCLQNSEAKCNTSIMRPFVCKTCGRRFKVRKSLTYHERHECQRFVFCPECNQKLKGAIVPSQHMLRCKKKKRQANAALKTKNNKNRGSQMILSTTDDDSD